MCIPDTLWDVFNRTTQKRKDAYLAAAFDGVGDRLDADGLAEVLPGSEILSVGAVKKVELLYEGVLEAATGLCALWGVAHPARHFAETGKVVVGRRCGVVGEAGDGKGCEVELEGWCCVAHGEGCWRSKGVVLSS